MTESPTNVPAAKRVFFDGAGIDIIALLLAGLAAWLADPWARPIVHEVIANDAGDVYGVLVGLQGTLLGFELAALTIVLGYLGGKQFDILREAGQTRNVIQVYLAAVITSAVGTVVAMIALVTSSGSGLHVWSSWATALICLLSVARFARILWATSKITSAL